MASSEFRSKVDSSISTAEHFTKLYYASFDKRRSKMGTFYLDTAVFVFNGNGAQNRENIQKALLELPPTEHHLTTLDVQPITAEAVRNMTTYLLNTGGTVKYQGQPVKPFQQSFILVIENDKWKIATDTYRTQTPFTV